MAITLPMRTGQNQQRNRGKNLYFAKTHSVVSIFQIDLYPWTQEYVQRQKEDSDAWTESGTEQPTYLSSGCIAQYEGVDGTEMMAFGVGMDTDEDARVSLSISSLTHFRSRIYLP